VNKILWHIFYTIDTPYEQEAIRLSEELESREIDFFLFGTPNNHDWMSNCLGRVITLNKTSSTGPIGLLDADMYCFGLAKDLRFAPEGVDILTNIRPKMPEHSKYCSGITAFLTPYARRVLQRWVDYCESDNQKDEKLREQLYLKHSIDMFLQLKPPIVLRDIGEHYNYVNDQHLSLEQMELKGIQVCHGGIDGPASRRYLSMIGGRR
jgi:hypothetical protein